jgi:hypothetical protein
MAQYRLKSKASNTIVKANLAKKSVKKAPPKDMKKYMVLQLDGCHGCRAKKNKSGGRYREEDLRVFAKVEMDKLIKFNIDTRQLNTTCPGCSGQVMFNRVKWWGAGFQDDTSVCLDSKGRKKIKVSDIKDITSNFLKYRETTLQAEIKQAESKLETMKKMQVSLKSATKGK